MNFFRKLIACGMMGIVRRFTGLSPVENFWKILIPPPGHPASVAPVLPPAMALVPNSVIK
jgi:hypothetical protein